VWRRCPLITGVGHPGVTHNGADAVTLGEWPVERNAGTERLDGFVARVGKRGRWLESNSSSSITEGKIRRVLELQRGLEVDAGAWNNHTLSIYMGTLESRRKIDAGSSWAGATYRGNGHGLLVRGSTNRHLVPYRETACVAHLDIGRAGPRIRS